MKYGKIDYNESNRKLFDKLKLQEKTQIEDIYSCDDEKERDLLAFLLNGTNFYSSSHSTIEIERMNEFDVKISINEMVYNLQEYEQNPYKYMLSTSCKKDNGNNR